MFDTSNIYFELFYLSNFIHGICNGCYEHYKMVLKRLFIIIIYIYLFKLFIKYI